MMSARDLTKTHQGGSNGGERSFRRIASVLVAVASIACSDVRPDSVDTGPTAAVQRDPLAPGASIVCGVNEQGGRPSLEFYVLSAMNHKLSHHPEFAAAVGADVVSDCEGARHFARVYEAYSSAHPSFDVDEPLGPVPTGESPPPADDGNATAETQKLLNGAVVTDHPVVKISFQVPSTGHPSWGAFLGTPSECSGSFINKNWILTAAHCVREASVYGCIVRGVSMDDCIPEWGNWASWAITRSVGGAVFTPPNSWARSYIHPNWTRDGDEYDVALIHVPTRDDHKLPPDIESNGALRFSTVTPDLAWPMRYYGWGNGSGGQLRMGEHIHGVQQFDMLDLSFIMTASIEARTRHETTPVPCGGDSGGPVVRTDLVLNANLERKPVEVILGVARASTGKGDCVQRPAGHHYWHWTRIDTDITREFIETTLTRWQPYKRIPCKTYGVGPVSDAVLECWGSPCAHDDDCEDSEYCFQSWNTISRSRQACSACDLLPDTAGTCNCIVGQCAAKKK